MHSAQYGSYECEMEYIKSHRDAGATGSVGIEDVDEYGPTAYYVNGVKYVRVLIDANT